MSLLKFGGNALANGKGITNTISILTDKINNNEKPIVVLSARGETTNTLADLLELAKNNKEYDYKFQEFKTYQNEPLKNLDLSTEFNLISKLLKGVKLTGDYSLKTKDLILAQGELIAAKTVAALLNNLNIKSAAIDSRTFLKTNDNFGNANINNELSEINTQEYFTKHNRNTTPIVTGFIASNNKNETTTLGRNGTNYSASLIADFLNIKNIESYTHVDGIFTANPEIVTNAKIIDQINYHEASELANFGATILHSKSIDPLINKNISLRILNTFNRDNKGTIINNTKTSKEIKSISTQENVALVNIIGKGLLGKKGIDARIFSRLSNINISVGIISQGSSERGVSFIIPKNKANAAKKELLDEFKYEISTQDIQGINSTDKVSVITIVGQNIAGFSSSLDYLKQNRIEILLINNTISGNNISIVIPKKNTRKAVNVIHSQVFGAIKTIHIAIVGKGTVGGSLINQILKSKEKIVSKKSIDLKVFAIAGSQKVLLNKNGITEKWENNYDLLNKNKNISKTIIDYAEKYHLENLIVIDNTASENFVATYNDFIKNGFDVISSNKIANTQQYKQYKKLRKNLAKYRKNYLYETNVGAGLPIIDTIKTLHESGENITRIKGVFSGSLSYLFNSFSDSTKTFSHILKQAIQLGYTEPDPREDLSGNDVARKLLILARELELENEFNDISIENLIPEKLRKHTTDLFLEEIESIDSYFEKIKSTLKKGYVLRYIGDLYRNLDNKKGELKVKLVAVPQNSALGNLKGSDSIFEIYTESYQDNPITIIGAGAGAAVTARGVFGDLLRIAEKKQHSFS